MATAAITAVTETGSSVKKITFAFTSSDTGTASASTTSAYSGKLIWCVIDPGATTPTAAWDLTVTDVDSIDLLAGGGADCSETATEYIAEASLGAIDGGVITFNVTNAGDQKTGTVYLWIR